MDLGQKSLEKCSGKRMNLEARWLQTFYILKYYSSPHFVKMKFNQKDLFLQDQILEDNLPTVTQNQEIIQMLEQQKSMSQTSKDFPFHLKDYSDVKMKIGNHHFMSSYQRPHGQNDKKSVYDSEYEYKQLLQDLRFHEDNFGPNKTQQNSSNQKYFLSNKRERQNKRLLTQIKQNNQYYFDEMLFQNQQNISSNSNKSLSQQNSQYSINSQKKKSSKLSKLESKYFKQLNKISKLQRLTFILNRKVQQNLTCMMEKLKTIYNYNCTYCQNCGNLFKNLRNNKSTCMNCRKIRGQIA